MSHSQTAQDLLPGHFVYIPVYKKFYKIGEVEPFQYDTGQETTAIFTALAIGASNTSFLTIDDLNPQRAHNTLFQIMFGVQHNMRYYFKVPNGTNRFGTDLTRGIGFIDNNLSPFDAPNKNYQVWAVRDYYPAISATNLAGVALTPALRFVGFKYDLKDIDSETEQKLKSGSLPYRHITIGGVNY